MSKHFLLLSLLFFVYSSFSAVLPKETVKWKVVITAKDTNGHISGFLYFTGAVYTGDRGSLPQLSIKYPVDSPDLLVTATITDPGFEQLSAQEIAVIDTLTNIPGEIIPICEIGIIQKQAFAIVNFVPLRKNATTGKLEKLVSYRIELIEAPNPGHSMSSLKINYDSSSVLATGNWVKMAVNQTGIYKLTFNDLQSMGLNVSTLNPKNIRIYGNGSSPLPESNSTPRIDDLKENNIQVVGEEDGKFDATDYILFYGTSPWKWSYVPSKGRFVHLNNYYTDYTYYFITADIGAGRRIPSVTSAAQTPNRHVTAFNDYAVHELDNLNLIKSGKTWYGEKFDLKLSYDLPDFSFPNIIGDSILTMEVDVAASSIATSHFKVYINNGEAANISVPYINPGSFDEDFAKGSNAVKKFYINTPNISARVDYLPSTSNSMGWLNYIEFNVMRYLVMSGSQMGFRSISSLGPGNVTEFSMNGTLANTRIWDVTDPTRPFERIITIQGNGLNFIAPTDSLREYIAFDGTSYLSIGSYDKIANQNLHALASYDMLIIHDPQFIDAAERLAKIHRDRGLTVLLETPDVIYNEFSSGCRDLTAIRDFSRMLYERAVPGKELKYLLFFGDASYDYKNRLPNNTNLIPTYQSFNSLSYTDSYATDDYFGLLDPNEGGNCAGNLDLGIGRFPVNTPQQASDVVTKIERYLGLSSAAGSGFGNNVPRLGDWRNNICFVADDENGDMHINQADTISTDIDASNHEYNLDKIYFDAYPQVSTPGGNRYPDVNLAINKRVSKGALIINYTGHGGETGWGHERVLEVSDINNWDNTQAMPVFITATCEFSRYDDPERPSAGEYAFLNPNGGGISLFTTSRLSQSATNFTLNKNFYRYVFDKINGEYPTMGDVIRKSKTPSNQWIFNFVLLGDPAVAIVYPFYKVETTSINGKIVSADPDTIKAFTFVTVEGFIKDDNGAKITSFNGTMHPTVYDKPLVITTLANDPDSYSRTFNLQNSIIYKGKTSVVNGDFSFSFYVPRDIAYKFGKGKISYYAENGVTDANGYYDNFIIGGSETQIEPDGNGPEVHLFMNDSNFVAGGITDENPVLLAYVDDEHGINTVGNGIGHDIVAILDDQTEKSLVLNDYYEAQLNSCQRGIIRYPFKNLPEGPHTLSLKVWDNYNNSSMAATKFVVAKSGNLTIDNLMNYPNPFSGTTSFLFNHNQAGGRLDVVITIFNLTGEVVKTLRTVIFPEGYHAGPLIWDGCNDHGDRLAGSLYIYRLSLTNEAGQTVEKSSKLVIVN